MSEQAAGWYNDPYGRFQQRHWNGTAWTEHVATNGVQQVDPMGASTVVPFATPASAFHSPTGGTAVAHGFAATPDLSDPNARAPLPQPPAMGEGGRARLRGTGAPTRRRPTSSTALAGIGGLMLAVGLLIAIAARRRAARS